MTSEDVALLARANGLTLPPESLRGVAADLDRLSAMAALLAAVSLDPEDEPLPVFRLG